MKSLTYLACIAALLLFATRSHGQGWQWARGNTGAGIEAYLTTTDRTGNVFVCGFASFNLPPVVFDTFTVPNIGYEGNQPIIAKYDPAGNVLWAIGTKNGGMWPISIATDASGNLYFMGCFSNSITVGSFTLSDPYWYPQYLLAKIDPFGRVLWAKNDGSAVESQTIVEPQSPGFTTGGIVFDQSGNCIITSQICDTVVHVGPFTLTNPVIAEWQYPFLVAKYDTAGNVIWAERFGSAAAGADNAFGITVSPAGDIYLAGIYADPYSPPSITFGSTTLRAFGGYGGTGEYGFVARLNASGTPAWACGIGGGTVHANAICADSLGNVYVAGAFTDSSISFNGITVNNPDPYSVELFVIKFDSANNVSWYKTISTTATHPTMLFTCYNLVVSPCGTVWISGEMVGDMNIDGNILPVPADSPDPIFIAGFNPSGGYAGGTTLRCGGDDRHSLSCDRSGNVFVCGDYQVNLVATAPFVIASDTLNYTDSSWGEVLFLAKYAPVKPDTNFSSMDTVVCFGEIAASTILTGPAGYANYLWSNNKTTQTDTVTALGSYSVVAFGSCSNIVVKDSFIITRGAPDTSYTRTDTSICAAGAVSLQAPAGYADYLWDNGNTTAAFTISNTGNFWVLCAIGCNVLFDSFHVSSPVNLSFSLGDDTTTCTPIELVVPFTGVTYKWQDGSTGRSYLAQRPGLYYVTVSKDGCSVADSISVNVINVTQHLPDTILCNEATVQLSLSATVPPGGKALWSTGSSLSSIPVTDTGRYWVTITDSQCTATDTAYIRSGVCSCPAFIPNAFTPNDDGKNDFFFPEFRQGCVISNYVFSIRNRWGQLVFYSTDPSEKWDGLFGGVKADLGVYMYYLEYASGLNKTNYFEKGDVTLVR